MADPRFIHLRVCSDFSISHGLAKISDLVKQAAALQMPALAVTDCCNLCGLVKFYDAAHMAGIKPLVGADLYLYHAALGESLYPMTVLAVDNQGYQNLTQLISKAYLRGHRLGAPAIEPAWLVEHQAGIILLSGGMHGDIGTLLLRDAAAVVAEQVAFYQKYFPDRYYLEVSRLGQPDEERYLQAAVALAHSTGLPLVATNPVCFIAEEDFEAHEIRVAIHDGYTLSDPKRPKKYTAQQYLCSASAMVERFADLPEAVLNSVEIAKRCNVTLRLGEYFLPQFPTGEIATDAYLVQRARQGLAQRLTCLFPDPKRRAAQQPRYEQRLERELAVINQLGFPGYFLIVMEFIQWSKQQDIPVGPGRGSGAGSLVAYVLQITDLDPLAFDLLFERFLNPARVSLPDFDIDFCMDQRDRVIEHVAERYGREAVSQIITFGTLAAKAVIRDVGRVLGHPYGFVDNIAKLVPLEVGITLDRAFALEPQLSALYKSDEEVRALIDRARKLEGITRNAGKHAAGVVIAPTKITDFAPLYCDPHGNHPVTQFDKSDVEYVGLLKFDFLGLRTLTIIHAALKTVNERLVTAEQPPIDISMLPLDDAPSFALLRRGETSAIFQLESRGIKELIKRLQPDCFEDLIALVALYRPGPLQSGMVDNFIDRKQGREAIAYPDAQYQHPLLQPILEPTYGIILYQEQVMQIAQALAGYSLEGADLLRRAMGKKNAEEMAEQRSVFEKGAKDNGIDGELAIKIFDLVEKFAGYGFNKSHSAAYALVSYQTLWLKSHFPADFMAAVLSADMDNTDKVVSLVEECRHIGLEVSAPDINQSHYSFTVNQAGAIVYGLGAIKGIGQGPVDAIIAAREAGGSFTTLFDLCTRTQTHRLNRRILEQLIMSGALDSLSVHRAALVALLDSALKMAEQSAKAALQGQVDMFGLSATTNDPQPPDHEPVPQWSEQQRLNYERQSLGLYLTGHPLHQYRQEIRHYTQQTLKNLQPSPKGQSITVAGLIVSAKIVNSKRGTRMGIVTLEDCSARLEMVLFSDILEQYRPLLTKDRLVVASGAVNADNFSGGLKMVVRELMEMSALRAKRLRGLKLVVHENQMHQQFCHHLRQALEPDCSAEGVPIQLYYRQAKAKVCLHLGSAWQVTPTDRLLCALRTLVGSEQVLLDFD